MPFLANLVLENATNPGTGTISLGGAPAGRRTFAQVAGTGTNIYYFLTDGTQTEWGIGTFTAGSPNTLARTIIYGNSAGTTAALSFTGACQVYNDVPAERAPTFDGAGNLIVGAYGGVAQSKIHSLGAANESLLWLQQTAASGTAQMSMYTDTGSWSLWVPSSQGNDFWYMNSSGTLSMRLTQGGAVYNVTGTYGVVSDATLKENIVPARSYLADLRKLDVVNYSLIADKMPAANLLGLLAQDVQKVLPGLVETGPGMKRGDPSILTLKASVFTFMLLQAVQELAAKLDALTASGVGFADPAV